MAFFTDRDGPGEFFNWISLVRLYHVFLPPYGQEAFRLLWNQPAVKTPSRYLLARPRA